MLRLKVRVPKVPRPVVLPVKPVDGLKKLKAVARMPRLPTSLVLQNSKAGASSTKAWKVLNPEKILTARPPMSKAL